MSAKCVRSTCAAFTGRWPRVPSATRSRRFLIIGPDLRLDLPLELVAHRRDRR
jgi:hypothetical protein